MRTRFSPSVRLAVILATAAFLAVLSVPALAQDDDISYELRDELENILKKKASDLYEKKDENGLRSQRGTYSKRFHKVDDATYQVTFTRDIAMGDRLKTERYLLTLSKEGNDWKVSDEELQDTYSRMVREVPGDETFRKFDRFEYKGQGLELQITNGTLLIDYVDGAPDSILLDGALTYSYAPPSDLDYHQRAIYEELKDRRDEDFEFKLELVAVQCDLVTCEEILSNNFTGLEEISRGSLGGELAKFYKEAEEDQRKARKERVFSGFRLPLEPDRRFHSIALKRDERDQWIGLRVDNDGPWDVQVWASDYGVLFGYLSDDSRAAGVEPWDDERRDDWDSRHYELRGLKGTVEVALEDPELLKADLEYTLVLKRDTQEIGFTVGALGAGFGGRNISERNPTIVIDSLETLEGEDLTWVLSGSRGGYVILPEKAKSGDVVRFRMAYQNRGSILNLTPSFSAMDRSGWLPFVRYTDKIDDFEMTVKAPAKFTIIGVGTKMDERVEGDVRITHWKAMSPVHFPTIIFGDYISGTPSIKATKSDGTEIPVTIYVDRDSIGSWEIRGKALAPLAEQAVNALNLYRELYGVDYPFGKLDLVADPAGSVLYGQAPASIIYLGNGVFRGEGAWASAEGLRDASDVSTFLKTVVSHEVAHQWWGSLIGNANMRNYWFVESMAEYSSALWVEAIDSDEGKNPEKGWKAYLDKTERWRRAVIGSDLVASIQDSTSAWGGEGGATSPYLAYVYNKGPYAMHILRMTFGTEKMDEFLRNLGQGLANQEIYTRDIQRIAEETFGGTMEWFFDQWIRGVGIPEYGFTYTYRQTEDGNWLVEGKIQQRVVAGKNREVLEGVYYRGIMFVTVEGRDKQDYPVKLLVEAAETPFKFKVPVEPRDVVLNKNGEMLAYDIIVNRPF